MVDSKEQLAEVSAAIGWTVPDDQKDDYAHLLDKAKAAFEAVDAMDDYQPTPDLESTPRTNIYLPEKKDNPLGAWAYRCTVRHAKPPSTLLKDKTICLKDNITLAGVPCLLGTDTFTGWTPITDATIITRILNHGGIIAGKAVCENLSRGAVSNTAASGPVDNPYAAGYSAGGSSSGTAALVASGEVDMGIGCDQGGSIRIPASVCGLYGMKATTGLVPYTGIVSNDASVDYVGPMTRTAMECATLLEVIAGVDGLDDRQIAGCPFPNDVPRYGEILRSMDATEAPLKGVKFGILKEGLEPSTLDPNVKAKFLAVAEVFERLGATVEEVSVPMHTQGRTIYTVVSKMGNHMGMLGRATGRRGVMLTDLFEKKNLPYTSEVIDKMNTTSKEGLLSGALGWQRHSTTTYAKAVNLLRQLGDLYTAALTHAVDFLIMPTTVTPSTRYPAPSAPPLEHSSASGGKLENTCAFNGTGHPALAMPIGFVSSRGEPEVRLPASLQIVGKFWDEANMLRAAYAWERAVDWRTF